MKVIFSLLNSLSELKVTIRDERTMLSLIKLSKTVDKFSMSMQEDFLSILTVVNNQENENKILVNPRLNIRLNRCLF